MLRDVFYKQTVFRGSECMKLNDLATNTKLTDYQKEKPTTDSKILTANRYGPAI